MLQIRNAQIAALNDALWERCLDRLRRAAVHVYPKLDSTVNERNDLDTVLRRICADSQAYDISDDDDVAVFAGIAGVGLSIPPDNPPALPWMVPILERRNCSGKARLGIICLVLRERARQDPAARRLMTHVDAIRKAFDAEK
jgi:hypothetical protein